MKGAKNRGFPNRPVARRERKGGGAVKMGYTKERLASGRGPRFGILKHDIYGTTAIRNRGETAADGFFFFFGKHDSDIRRLLAVSHRV